MNDMLFVHMCERCRNLRDISCCPFFWEPPSITEMFINVSTRGEFEEEVYALVVVEIPVQTQNVDVPQI